MRSWDVFCRVIDNLGDAGVCWRFGAELAARGQTVRLFIDDAAPLAFMAPRGAAGIEVRPWPSPTAALEAADVVVETFGCELPPQQVQAMQARATPPVWINLEHLSAEPYVERSHGLPSPQPSGLPKWFFFPGFTPRTGGLLREAGLAEARRRFDREPWFAQQGIERRPGERTVLLFCYVQDRYRLHALLDALAGQPTLLLLAPGPAQEQVRQAPPGVRLHALPWLSQTDFDHALWSTDLNFVRGEDSLVRALWAGAPFVWQAYPQHDNAHHAKVQALLERLAAPPEWAGLWRAWNGMPGAQSQRLALPSGWPGLQVAHRALIEQPDLVTQLLAFVETRSRGIGGC
jgi:uncharacterized repeat protein (TIGR03837 family)